MQNMYALLLLPIHFQIQHQRPISYILNNLNQKPLIEGVFT
jgi:hypothetical protein